MLRKTSKFSVFSGPSPVNSTSTTNILNPTIVPRSRSNLGESYEQCQDIYEEVFSCIPCERSCKASLSDRDSMKVQKDYTLTYGELVDMAPMWKLINKLKSDFDVSLCNITRFYDLGSGSGRPAVAAALTLSQLSSQDAVPRNHTAHLECIGIEILPSLYDLSILAQNQWDEYQSKWKSNASCVPAAELRFYLGSIFDLSVCDWTDGDIVYVNSTCFDVSMMLKVHDIATHMKVGSIIITLSRSMIEIEALAKNIRDKCVATVDEPPTWQLLFETREQMSWGFADYFVHLKLN